VAWWRTLRWISQKGQTLKIIVDSPHQHYMDSPHQH